MNDAMDVAEGPNRPGASLRPRTQEPQTRALLRLQAIFLRHYTLQGFPSILVCRCVPTY